MKTVTFTLLSGMSILCSTPESHAFIPIHRTLSQTKLHASSEEEESSRFFGEECPLDNLSRECLTGAGYASMNDPARLVQQIYVAEIESLRNYFDSYENEDEEGSNRIKFNNDRRGWDPILDAEASKISDGDSSSPVNTHVANREYNFLIEDDELVLLDTIRKSDSCGVSRAFHRAGPRKNLHFDPSTVNAAIVTCGGLCPGLNNVIREIVRSLSYLYGANKVYGITGGFNGFHKPEYEPIEVGVRISSTWDSAKFEADILQYIPTCHFTAYYGDG